MLLDYGIEQPDGYQTHNLEVFGLDPRHKKNCIMKKKLNLVFLSNANGGIATFQSNLINSILTQTNSYNSTPPKQTDTNSSNPTLVKK